MGQIFVPSNSISIIPTDRIVVPGAGAGQSGNRVFLVGAGAGANSTVADTVVIGNGALAAGLTNTFNNADGMTVVGVRAGAAMTVSRSATAGGASTLVGSDVAPLLVSINTSVLVGRKIAASMVGASNQNDAGINGTVIIGIENFNLNNPVVGNESLPTRSVVIGWRAAFGTQVTPAWQCQNSIIIGSEAARDTGGGTASATGLVNDIVIGTQAALTIGTGGVAPGSNIILGHQAAQSITNGGKNVIIGQAAVAAGPVSNTVIIGQGATCSGFNGCVILGAGAASSSALLNANSLLIEVNNGGNKQLIMGRFDLGNLVLGGGATLDRTGGNGTNTVKLLNGTLGGGNPTGGGYFYVTAGALHWVGSAGTDTAVAPA